MLWTARGRVGFSAIVVSGLVSAIVFLILFVVQRGSSQTEPSYDQARVAPEPNVPEARAKPVSPREKQLPEKIVKKERKEPKHAEKKSNAETFVRLRINAKITSGGQPVAGAHLVDVRALRRGPGGFLDRGLPFSISSRDAITDEQGEVAAVFLFPRSISDDSLVGVSAYDPEKGSYYREFTFGELKNLHGEKIPMELEPRTTLQGRIVDPSGRPAAGVQVLLGTMWPGGGIPMAGIKVNTDENGAYKIAGIGFDNKVRSLRIVYFSRKGRRIFSKKFKRSPMEAGAEVVQVPDITLPEEIHEE